MIHRTWYRTFGAALLLLSTLPSLAAGEARFADKHAEAIETLLRENFSAGDAGTAIGVLDEHGSWVFSAGKLGNGTDGKVDGDSIFEICSVSKVFTSLLLVDAVRRGEMQLEDPVAKYLPASVRMPTHKGKSIQLLHLAAQDSSLPFNPVDSPGGNRVDVDAFTADDLYRFLSGYELTVDPGAAFQYSNTGMALLGNVLERRTGMDYESLVVDRICRPLEMHSTRITLTPEQATRFTQGHGPDGRRVPHMELHVMASAGALLSTANDLLKFLSANLGFGQSHLTPLMSETLVVRHRDSPRFGKTAMPWFDEGVYNPPGTEILAHGGGNPGYRAFLGLDKIKRRGVVVLTNQTSLNPMGVGWTLLQEMPLTSENVTNWVREVVGIGIALGADDTTGEVHITSVFPKSPAGQAGLAAGLVIKSIDGVSVAGKDSRECAELMGGPAGQSIRLEVFDRVRAETTIIELTRARYLTASS